jgi:hypothetical protein
VSKPEPIPQRIGDAERDQATSLLTDHLVAGRLTQGEFDERLSVAMSARTADELTPLFSDLPGPRPGPVAVPEETLPDQTRRRTQELMAEAKARQEPAEPVREPKNRALVIASTIAWPVILLVLFATSWDYWWLIFIPIALSSLAGKGWAGHGPGRDRDRRRELGQ